MKHLIRKTSLSAITLCLAATLITNPAKAENDVLPNLFQCMQELAKGNQWGAEQEIKQAMYYANRTYIQEGVTLKVLLQQAMRASDTPRLSPQQKHVVMSDFVSQAVEILIRDQHVPGIDKKILQTAIKYLRLAKLLTRGDNPGGGSAQLIKATFFLEAGFGPAIQRAIDLTSRAYMATQRDKDAVVVQLINEAIDTIQGSKAFNGVGSGGGHGHGGDVGKGPGKGKGGGRF